MKVDRGGGMGWLRFGLMHISESWTWILGGSAVCTSGGYGRLLAGNGRDFRWFGSVRREFRRRKISEIV